MLSWWNRVQHRLFKKLVALFIFATAPCCAYHVFVLYLGKLVDSVHCIAGRSNSNMSWIFLEIPPGNLLEICLVKFVDTLYELLRIGRLYSTASCWCTAAWNFLISLTVWAWENCRISPPQFLADECYKRRLNQGRFCFAVFCVVSFFWACLFFVLFIFFICLMSCIFQHEPTWMALYSLIVLMCR